MQKLQIVLWVTGFLLISFSACHRTSSSSERVDEEIPDKPHRPSALNNGRFFNEDGKMWLYGGKRDDQHFDISNCDLQKEQFHYGLGREAFPALLAPEFISVETADKIWNPEERFLIAAAGNDVKAYAIKDLIRHEVVNDSLNGHPIFAAYCILADLGAIYDRKLGGRTYTFALSGYTYFDPEVWDGLDGFVLWDRETESLWWPLIGAAVSGPLKGSEMQVLEEKYWKQTNWEDIRNNYPEAKVLRSGQDFNRPKSWSPKYPNAQPIEVKGKPTPPPWDNAQGLDNH